MAGSLSIILALACKKDSIEECNSCGGECQQDALSNDGQDHQSGDLDYDDSPPASGDHNSCWSQWGIFTESVLPENWLHNLEHGGVVVLYNCPEGCSEEQSSLEEWAKTLAVGRVVLTPYSDMDWQFAIVAWQHRLLLQCLDLEAMQAFYDANVGRAPENIIEPPPPSCEDTAAGGGM
jgi:hypothetical protein